MLVSCQVCGGRLPMNMNVCDGCVAEAKTYWPGKTADLAGEVARLRDVLASLRRLVSKTLFETKCTDEDLRAAVIGVYNGCVSALRGVADPKGGSDD
jgi:hypothetical protein